MTTETVNYPRKKFAELGGVFDVVAPRAGCLGDQMSKLTPCRDTTANSTWGVVCVGAEAVRRMLGACIVSANLAVYEANSSGVPTRQIGDVRPKIRAALAPQAIRQEEPIASFFGTVSLGLSVDRLAIIEAVREYSESIHANTAKPSSSRR